MHNIHVTFDTFEYELRPFKTPRYGHLLQWTEKEGWCEMRRTAVNSDWRTTSFQRLHVAPPSPAAYELHRPNRKNNVISFCNVKQCFKRRFGIFFHFFQICNIFNVLVLLISVLQFKHDKRKKSNRVGGEWCYGLKSQNISTQILFLQYAVLHTTEQREPVIWCVFVSNPKLLIRQLCLNWCCQNVLCAKSNTSISFQLWVYSAAVCAQWSHLANYLFSLQGV